jgi:RNA polymerase sigma-70 factor (ECF subfamily)
MGVPKRNFASFRSFADTMQPPSDETILRQVYAGEVSAFASLYERYKNGVYAYCFRLLRDAAPAEDALQNIFTRAFESIRTLDDPSAFKYWLFMIARNEVYGVIRKLRSPNREKALDESEDLWDPETPLTQAVRSNQVDIIQEQLGHLRPEYREVLILREYEQFSYAEIAVLTGDTEGSVRARIFKARKALAKKLKPYFT